MVREQRQMVTLKAPGLEKNDVIEALYLLLGQDYKGGDWNADRNRRFQSSWRSQKAYAADDYVPEEEDDDIWEYGYYEAEEAWPNETTSYMIMPTRSLTTSTMMLDTLVKNHGL